MNKSKLKNLLGKLSSFDTEVEDTFSSLDKEMANVTARLKETITAKTLEQVNVEFKKLQDSFKPLISAFADFKTDIQASLTKREKDLVDALESKTNDFKESIKENKNINNSKLNELSGDIKLIQDELNKTLRNKVEIPNFSKQIQEVEERMETMIGILPNDDLADDIGTLKKQISDIEDALKKIRIDLINKLSNIHGTHGGGNMNRQIRVEGVDVLTKYTDINLVGISSSIITTVDNTNKRINIRFPSSGGGGGTPGGSDTQVQYNNAGSFGGITGATTDGTTLTLTAGRATTNFSPTSNDGAALGTTALQFSDLFLAEGGVINWDNGDVTATQTGNDLSFAGASTYRFDGLVSTTTGITLEETGAGTDVIAIQAPAAIAAGYTLTLPVDDGAANEVLATDGSGVLSWSSLANNKIVSVGITIDGGGSAITTGIKGYVEIPYACTINRVTMLADVSGSIVVDIWKDTYANFPPLVADSITASAKPTITTAVKSQDSTLTGWTTSISAGDILAFNVDSATTITRLNLILKVTKT